MPSSGRKQRHLRKQQKKVADNSRSNYMDDDDSYEDTSSAAVLKNYTGVSPKPYHDDPAATVPPPPPPFPAAHDGLGSFQHRSISDVTMEDHTDRSVFEYSDTSDDADAYFMPQNDGQFQNSPPSLLNNFYLMGKNHPSSATYNNDGGSINKQYASSGKAKTNHHYKKNYNPHDHSNRSGSSGESAFRDLKKNGSKSTKIVRFSPRRSGECEEHGFRDDDEESTIISRIMSTSPASTTDSETKGENNPLLGGFMKHVANVFNTPTGLETTRRSSRINTKKNSESSTGHRRKDSHMVTEYPYLMVNMRNTSSGSSALKDLNRNSLENSPLLPTAQRQSIYGAGQDIATPEYYRTIQTATTSASVNSNKIPKPEAMERMHSENSYSAIDNNSGNPMLESSRRPSVVRSRLKAAQVAAYFLMDYEASRVTSLPCTFETITSNQLVMYKIYFSWQWRYFVNLAIILLFLSHTRDTLTTAIMTTLVIAVLGVEIHIRERMYGTDARTDTKHLDRRLVRSMVAFLFILGLETWMWYFISPEMAMYEPSNPPLFSSFFKPLVLFYVSAKARDSLEAIFRISQIVIRILLLEFFIILIFASVGNRVFGKDFDDFIDLHTSWLSLFKLSTTVNNPSLWMPIYAKAASNSIFFVVFIITCVFYYHSLVLSVVFQTYIQAITDIHERTASDRNDAIRLAFLALLKDGQSEYISTSSVRKCLQVVRPHYNSLKMNALLEIFDPTNENIIAYPTFRNKIRRALNSSVRTARTATPLAMGVEFIAVFVAATNCFYVTGKALYGRNDLGFETHGYVGSAITLFGLLELTIRFNPLKIPNFAPITRLDVFFDGMALLAALISCYGIIQYAMGYETLIESGDMFDYLRLGRDIDMIRVLRFSPIFRDIVRRSSDVLPTLAGPMMLFLSVIHTFVYVGIVLWDGAIDVALLSKNEALTPLYCLNNFNSYTGGLITMFNVAVVNDWHAIAEVYTQAERNNSDAIVYSFFVSAICFIVYIMINVIIAFFVETFVTKTNEPADESNPAEETTANLNNSFRIQNSENTNVRRIRSCDKFYFSDEDAEDEALLDQNASVISATSSTNSEVFAAFDIYEREGFDQIMRTVAGSSDDEQEAFARSVCNYLERFESLTFGREKVGYMVCCQQSMNRFGNRRFQTSARSFLTEEMLHKVVSDMHAELLVLTSTRKNSFGNRCLVRTFPETSGTTSQHLEIAATLLRHQPAATLFSSRIRPNKATGDK